MYKVSTAKKTLADAISQLSLAQTDMKNCALTVLEAANEFGKLCAVEVPEKASEINAYLAEIRLKMRALISGL
jgi:hypothetical protein